MRKARSCGRGSDGGRSRIAGVREEGRGHRLRRLYRLLALAVRAGAAPVAGSMVPKDGAPRNGGEQQPGTLGRCETQSSTAAVPSHQGTLACGRESFHKPDEVVNVPGEGAGRQ